MEGAEGKKTKERTLQQHKAQSRSEKRQVESWKFVFGPAVFPNANLAFNFIEST